MNHSRAFVTAISLMAVLLFTCMLPGCVTQRHIREVRADVQRVESKVDQNNAVLARIDSLITANAEANGRLRADVNSTTGELQRQLASLLENYNEMMRLVHEIHQRTSREILVGSTGATQNHQLPLPASDNGSNTAPQEQTPAPCDSLYDTALTENLNSEYETAINGFRKFIDLCPDHEQIPSAYRWIAVCQYWLGKYSEAIATVELMDQRFKENPIMAAALYYMARSKLELDRRDEAKAVFQRVVDEHPGTLEANQAQEQLDQLK